MKGEALGCVAAEEPNVKVGVDAGRLNTEGLAGADGAAAGAWLNGIEDGAPNVKGDVGAALGDG